MARPVIITCAVTGGADTVGKHPAIPVTPEQIATAAIEAAKAGAAIACTTRWWRASATRTRTSSST